MADNTPKPADAHEEGAAPAAPAAPAATDEVKKKKLRPTNCVQSNKRIRRKDWYYRNGKYFANKQCFKLHDAAEKSTKVKKAAPAAGAAEEKAAG